MAQSAENDAALEWWQRVCPCVVCRRARRNRRVTPPACDCGPERHRLGPNGCVIPPAKGAS